MILCPCRWWLWRSTGTKCIHYVPVLLSKCQILSCIVRESNPGPPDRTWTLYHWAIESVHNMGVLTSQYFSPNAKYWTASSGNRTRPPLIECGHSTIELWNLYIIWVCLCPSSSLQMTNIELHRPGIEPGPPLIECGHSSIELWNLFIIWVCLRPSTSLQMPNIELHRPRIEPGPPW